MLLADVVDVSQVVAARSARSAKVGALATLLRLAATALPIDAGMTVTAGADVLTASADDSTAWRPSELAIVVAYLSGELRQRRTGVGWAAVRDLPHPTPFAVLTVVEVDAAFERIANVAGAGSQATRATELRNLFAAATPAEQRFLQALATGELRQGALDGVMVDAIAKAADVPLALVRQAFMLRGSLPPVAVAALTGGTDALNAIGLELGRPLRPMLAQSVPSVAEALAKVGGTVALEWKLDGIRVQIHRQTKENRQAGESGVEVQVFTRTLDDITARVPELVEVVTALDVHDVVLDGEAIALDERGWPRPFQETAARTSSRLDVEALRQRIPLTVFVFDVLQLDGEPLLPAPASRRQQVLETLLPKHLRVPRLVTDDPDEAGAFFAAAIARGHEGVVVKSLDAPYEAGRRGAGWVKVKPRHTLDLVVLAAEWGHGRRRGKLSNLHLGARDGAGGFVMLGKTFKGLTDELLSWQTEQFLRIETHRDAYTVYVEPNQVVEIAFDGVQTSSRYPGGVALRFARVLRYRPDKGPGDADHIDDVRAIHTGGTRAD